MNVGFVRKCVGILSFSDKLFGVFMVLVKNGGEPVPVVPGVYSNCQNMNAGQSI